MRLLIYLACGAAALSVSACGGSDQPAADGVRPAASASSTTNSNYPEPSPAATPAGTNIAPSAAGTGDPIDTSKYDAEIARLKKQTDREGGEASAHAALAKAYLARASALTEARQYRAALGDYRRTLRYDPGNEQAQEMSSMIVSILRKMGREVPAEGQEPTPLPFTPGAGDHKKRHK